MKDAKGHGSNKKGGGMPIPGHPYHKLASDSLRYIAKDAGEAERNVRDFDQQAASKYSDQIANAASVLGYRARGGTDFSDKAAAAALAQGSPKSDTVPVHEGAAGRSDFGPNHTVSQVTLGGKVKSTAHVSNFYSADGKPLHKPGSVL